jgi:hypothetical protein
MRDPAVRGVMSKVKHMPLERTAGQAEPPDRVTVKLKNGAVHTVEVAERQTLTTKGEIEEKFFACATLALSQARAERLADLVGAIEKLADIGALMRCMNGEMLATA